MLYIGFVTLKSSGFVTGLILDVLRNPEMELMLLDGLQVLMVIKLVNQILYL